MCTLTVHLDYREPTNYFNWHSWPIVRFISQKSPTVDNELLTVCFVGAF